tara:strand:- start:5716 stop:6366 length:651 start_codon:yes stop_codon:yes gene_type:complete
MKTKLLFVFLGLIVIAGYNLSYASSGDALSIIRDIEFEGLSLNSTAEDIEAFLSSKPDWQCQRVDNPESERHPGSNRPPTPRYQSWSCVDYNPANPETFLIKMSGGVMTHFKYDTSYKDAGTFDKIASYIKDLNVKFEATELSTQTNDKEYRSYNEQDIQGSSSPVFMQNLKVKIQPECEGTPIFYLVSVNSNKMASQNIYRAGVKIDRSTYPLGC